MTDLQKLLAKATQRLWWFDNNEGYGPNAVHSAHKTNPRAYKAVAHAVGDSAEAEANARLVAMASELVAENASLKELLTKNLPAELLDENQALNELVARIDTALIKAKEALVPFDEIAGEMFARNWNDDGVAISFITQNGPLRLTFKEFRAVRATMTEIKKLRGE